MGQKGFQYRVKLLANQGLIDLYTSNRTNLEQLHSNEIRKSIIIEDQECNSNTFDSEKSKRLGPHRRKVEHQVVSS